MKAGKMIVVILILILFITVPASAFVFLPVKDGFVFDSSFAGFTKDNIPDGVTDHVFEVLDAGNASFEDRGILEFDIASVNNPVDKAILNLNISLLNGPFPFQVDVYGYSGDGELTTSDWDKGTLFHSIEFQGTEKNVHIDVTNSLNSLLSNKDKFAGYNFRAINSTGAFTSSFVTFGSLESNEPNFPSNPSTLSVSVVPEPASFILFGFGIIGFFIKKNLYSSIT